jgi:hypothetical protein
VNSHHPHRVFTRVITAQPAGRKPNGDQPVFLLGVIPALVWPNMRVEIEVTAIRRVA